MSNVNLTRGINAVHQSSPTLGCYCLWENLPKVNPVRGKIIFLDLPTDNSLPFQGRSSKLEDTGGDDPEHLATWGYSPLLQVLIGADPNMSASYPVYIRQSKALFVDCPILAME